MLASRWRQIQNTGMNYWLTSIFTPDTSAMAVAWVVLYMLIVASNGFVIYQAVRGQFSWWVALPFILNLACNALFTQMQNDGDSFILASIAMVLTLGTLIWSIASIWPKHRWVGIAQTPYLLWVATATLLQLQITLVGH